MTNIMLDLETMGTGPDAAIVAIGAVAFDVEAGRNDYVFYKNVSLGSSMRAGGEASADTIMWWIEQGAAARQGLTDVMPVDIKTALDDFDFYCTSFEGPVLLWGNGADFDNVILGSAYHRCGLTPPWKFYNNRCYRTLKNLMGEPKTPHTGTKHNALDDAIAQAEHAVQLLRRLK